MLERMDDFFTTRCQGYDEHMRENVEGDAAFYEFTASLLPKSDNAQILDLGCGTRKRRHDLLTRAFSAL